MKFMHRNRTLVAVITMFATLLAHVAPVGAWYDPKTGRFLQRDPNGTALLVSEGLSYSARNPTVHVWITPQLQYGDGMNFYQYVMSNPVNYTDPTGLFSFVDILTTAGVGAYARVTSTAASGASLGYFASTAAALALRNQILTGITNTASRLPVSQSLNYLSRANQVLNNAANRVFNENTYRAGYGWLMGGLDAASRVHHIFPQKFVEFFSSKGINIHMPTWLMEVETKLHSHLSHAYNLKWQDFLREHGKTATVEQIFEFAKKTMVEIFKLEVSW